MIGLLRLLTLATVMQLKGWLSTPPAFALSLIDLSF
jgi:hypothetical protein